MNLFGEDVGGFVGNLGGQFWILVVDGNLDDFGIFQGGNGDFLGELIGGLVFELKILFDLVQNQLGLNNFAISTNELLVDVDIVQRGGSCALVGILSQDYGRVALVEIWFAVSFVNYGAN